jgi:formate hydrogenlyase transcriptional activator
MQSKFESYPQFTTCERDEISHHCRELFCQSPEQERTSDLHNIVSRLLNGLRDDLPHDHLGIGLFTPQAAALAFLLQAGQVHMPAEIPVNAASLGVMLRDLSAIEVSDVHCDERFPEFRQRAESMGFCSFRITPLIIAKHLVGVVCVQRQEAGMFSAEDVRTLNHAAQLIVCALENAILADVLGREKQRFETLRGVNAVVTSILHLNDMFTAVAKLIHDVVRQDCMYVALYEKSKNAMTFHVLEAESPTEVISRDELVQLSECPAGICFERGESLRFSHADLLQVRSEYMKDLLDSGTRSVLCFPMVSQGRKLGALCLSSVCDEQSSADVMVLVAHIAAQLAMAIDSERAHEEIAALKDKIAKEKSYFEDEIRSLHNFGEVIGSSPSLCQVLNQVEIAAPSDATVLLLGETGTGKELVARAVHRLSSRRNGNFIKVNCAAIPSGLLESELFGHEKGAFTGAISQKLGRVELADKGTLFLDEIGEIPQELQPKLLRVLQDQEFERLGGVRTIKVNVRLIAATNLDLARAVDEHQFRSDLYYRLNVFPIVLPPLRERAGDIPLLVRYFVQKFARRMGKSIESIPVEIIKGLEGWHWPGNIRELENFLERSVILTQGRTLYAPMAELRMASPDTQNRSGTLEQLERQHILQTLRESGGVISGMRGAAARLGMKRTTLQSRIQRLGISREDFEI